MQFRYIHFHTKVHFGALSNWFSAAAIWFVLAVSVERLLIIKFPFRSYHHVSHTCITRHVCSGTQLLGLCFSNAGKSWGKRANPTSSLTREWIELSVYLNASFAVLLPVFAVAVLNISLIRLLKKRNSEELLVNSVNASPEALHEQERKMTTTVLAIVTSFTLTQGPSAIVTMYQMLYGPRLKPYLTNASFSTAKIASVVANQLVLTGKMLNVVLFCMTSSTFRRKLLQTCTKWLFTICYCDEVQRRRLRLSQKHSKSVMTQRTSIISSWSFRGMRSSFMSHVSQK
ncbi:unnamed protein product [Strongylus vulgaris]|uniref:G-protein coupled receptors family 1 profile domain-containing protein n=1 Tax=Strongylus vulgaris TaxID=40348 RepID=A0A3P7IH89_STRVU|nr:unnamed protein product [Strongylus vulgaris]